LAVPYVSISAVEEETMHKFTPLIAAVAVCAAGVSLAGRAEAGALTGAEGPRAAVADLGLIEAVHCTPGFAHRRTPPRDGCYRRVYRAPYPAYSYGYGPYAYGYPYGYYRPGIGIGIGGWGHRGWGPGVGIGFGW
jgi:hypothetical protein